MGMLVVNACDDRPPQPGCRPLVASALRGRRIAEGSVLRHAPSPRACARGSKPRRAGGPGDRGQPALLSQSVMASGRYPSSTPSGFQATARVLAKKERAAVSGMPSRWRGRPPPSHSGARCSDEGSRSRTAIRPSSASQAIGCCTTSLPQNYRNVIVQSVLSEKPAQMSARAPWWSPLRYEVYHGRKRVLYGTAVDLLFQLPNYLALAVVT